MDTDHRMVDPLPVTVAVLTSIADALESTKSLSEAVIAVKERDLTLGRLQNELKGLHHVLVSLTLMTDAQKSMVAFAQDPIHHCSQICDEFERSLNLFAEESRGPFRDWRKMQCMGTDINELIDTVEEYKSTIAISLGMVTMYFTLPCLPETLLTSSRYTSPEYIESIENTAHNIEKRLRRIDEKLSGVAIDNTDASLANIDLNFQKKSASQCLRICQDARSHIKVLADRVSAQTPEKATGNDFPNDFTALLQGSQNIDSRPPKSLEFPPPGSDSPDLRLQDTTHRPELESGTRTAYGVGTALLQGIQTLNIDSRPLEPPSPGSDRAELPLEVSTKLQVPRRQVVKLGEVVANGGSDQVVVPTSRNQLVGSRRMTDRELQDQVKAHYRHHS